jgi:hypothetical protein
MTKVYIATPAFDGKVNVQYAIAMAETHTLLKSHGIDVEIGINCSGSLLVAERNRLNKQFLKSECTHMLCIDSDLGWPAQAVLGLLGHNVDFVAGLYPARGPDKTFLFRPIYDEDKSIIRGEKGLLKMNYIPAGFMLIKRHVIERMTAHFAHLYFEPKHKNFKHENGFCLYNTEVVDGEFWGEDYVFSRRVREAGFEILVDPYIEFDHAGVRGAFIQALTNTKENIEENKECDISELSNQEVKHVQDIVIDVPIV